MAGRVTTTLRVVLFLIACPVVLIVASPLSKVVSAELGPLMVGAVTSVATLALTMLFVRWDGVALRDVGMGFDARTVPRYLAGFLIGAALVGLQDGILFACGHTHWEGGSGVSFGAVLVSLVGWVSLALREELAFRGYPSFRLKSAWGMWVALAVIAVVFTLEHAAGGWAWSRLVFGPFLGALLFGLAAFRTRGLAVPLGIHSAFNFCQWVMGQKEELAGPFRAVVDAGYERQTEAVGYAAYGVGMVVAAGFFLWSRGRWVGGD